MQRKNRGNWKKCNVIGITGMMIHMTELLKSLVTTSSEGQSRFQLKYTAVLFFFLLLQVVERGFDYRVQALSWGEKCQY